MDANTYYEKRYRELRENQVVKEKKRLGIGFITFRKEDDAKMYVPCVIPVTITCDCTRTIDDIFVATGMCVVWTID